MAMIGAKRFPEIARSRGKSMQEFPQSTHRGRTMPRKAGALLVMAILLVRRRVAAAQGGKDPGVRGGRAGAGGPPPASTSDEPAFCQAGLPALAEVAPVRDGAGPRF